MLSIHTRFSSSNNASFQIRPSSPLLTPDIIKLTPHIDVSSFSCDDPDLDEFLKKDSLSLQNENLTQVYVAYHDSVVFGYIALLCDNIMLQPEEKEQVGLQEQAPRSIPALKIGRLAASKSHRNSLRGIGTSLMRFAFYQTIILSDIAGCRLLIVDAYPQSVGFYQKLGLTQNLHGSYQGRNRTTVSMRFDVFAKTLPEWTK